MSKATHSSAKSLAAIHTPKSKPKTVSGAPERSLHMRRDADGPTPEREAKGDYKVEHVDVNVEGRIETAKVKRDRDQNWIAECLKSKKISAEEASAAEWLGETIQRAEGGGLRSCIDFSVRSSGGDGAGQASASKDKSAVYKLVGPLRFAVLHSCCADDKPTGKRDIGRTRWRFLKEGLEMVASWKEGVDRLSR